MNPAILGGMLKNFYDTFNMNSFENRFKVQKIIYLMKSKGFNLGYNFNLYLYGPYCSELNNDAHQMVDLLDFQNSPVLVPSDKKEIFLEFVSKLRENGRKENMEWLEIVSSFVFLKNNTGKTKEEIIEYIKNKRIDFDIPDARINEIIEEIEEGGYFI